MLEKKEQDEKQEATDEENKEEVQYKEKRDVEDSHKEEIANLKDDIGKVREELEEARAEAPVEEEAHEEDEDEEVDAEEVIRGLLEEREKLELEKAYLQIANHYNIPADKMNYFDYLMNQAMAGIPEGGELPEEALLKVVDEVSRVSGGQMANSSVEGKPPSDEGNEVEIDYNNFLDMNLVERQQLFLSNRKLYEQYKQKAIRKKEFVIN